jgi:SAM-dependent methyltransferase
MHIFAQVFSALPRQGPGSQADTLRALAGVSEGFDPIERILDVGCGCGAQSMVLARHTSAHLTAVDLSGRLLQRLNASAVDQGLSHRVSTVQCSMKDMPLPPGSFDLIWSEGAVYIMGFEAALESFRALLRPGGRVAISHQAWMVPEPPAEAAEFWAAEGGAPLHDHENRLILERQGYRLIDAFTVSAEGWWDNYLDPMAAQIAAVRPAQTEPAALAVLDALEGELAIHRAHLGTYNYVFYLAELA